MKYVDRGEKVGDGRRGHVVLVRECQLCGCKMQADGHILPAYVVCPGIWYACAASGGRCLWVRTVVGGNINEMRPNKNRDRGVVDP